MNTLVFQVGALQLEGCSFDGVCLCENQHNSPSVSAIPTCYLAWVLQVCEALHSSCGSLKWDEMCIFLFNVFIILSVVMEELCRFLHLRWHNPAAVIHKLREGEAGDPRLLPLWFKPQSMDTVRSRPLPQTAVTVHHKLTWTHLQWLFPTWST